MNEFLESYTHQIKTEEEFCAAAKILFKEFKLTEDELRGLLALALDETLLPGTP